MSAISFVLRWSARLQDICCSETLARPIPNSAADPQLGVPNTPHQEVDRENEATVDICRSPSTEHDRGRD
jgi:hypothetical protein